MPSSIGITTKLPKRPKKGLKVIFLDTGEAAGLDLAAGFTQAAKSLGWKPTILNYSAADPGAAVQSAINEGFKYIASASISLASITPQAAEMKAKHIAFFEAYENDVPKFKANALYGQSSSPAQVVVEGKMIADQMTTDSGGSGVNALYVTLPLYPVLTAQGTAAAAELAKNCSNCSLTNLPITVPEFVGGQIPALIVGYLQSHPTTNYVYFSFQDMYPGVYAALQTANLLGQVKLIGTEGEQAQLADVVNGRDLAWSILPENEVMWVVVDWMARLSEGVLTQKNMSEGNLPMYLANSKGLANLTLANMAGNVPAGVWGGPTNYQRQFKELWRVVTVQAPRVVVSRITGVAVPGRRVVMRVLGSNFSGTPKVTSNAAGTTVRVARTRSSVLSLLVTTRAGTGKGVHLLTIRFSNGQVRKIRYNVS
ncbi:MAG: sugar ABC transporter substrate-binding protein [Acidimicrobiales bacterium]